MSKHTPGPWKYGPHENNERQGYKVYMGSHSAILNYPVPLSSKFHEADLRESQSNARLIAAAPDLLAAAKLVAHGNLSPEGLALAMWKLRDAITRAEGGAK